MNRAVTHGYIDPLDQVWIETARRIGLRVRRAGDVYASTGGDATLTICTRDGMDADDCLAQMIFHEICHSLVEGDEAFFARDVF